jgi:hypothetical protein
MVLEPQNTQKAAETIDGIIFQGKGMFVFKNNILFISLLFSGRLRILRFNRKTYGGGDG